MRDNLSGALWRFGVFALVCVVATFAVFMIFASLRFQKERVYTAEFSNVAGLEEGNFVRIAGVEVGKVKNVSITPRATALVDFTTDESVELTQGTQASIRWLDLIGGRYLALEEGVGGVEQLSPGEVIPLNQTRPALDLDTLLGGFRPLFRALDPDQVNALSGQLIHALQGEGTTISSFLAQAATVTSTLADRDELIGQVIKNLNTVLGSLSEQSGQFAKTVESLSDLVDGLAARGPDIANAVAYANEASGTIADLLTEARPPLKETVAQSDRATSIVVADHEYFDNLLHTLPDTYQLLSRQGMYGDFFSFYLCDAVLKLNGKGGQPVYVKVAGQNTGRCAPK
jgi:phospholipid/cholesterol/gamma-HCH transport system substrate-binding protein